ncbi:MAG: hypothetical protein KIT73_18785 [Burkholderiales bacterium]|nr:hypothetical protein [Burkholderiales bacterium]
MNKLIGGLAFALAAVATSAAAGEFGDQCAWGLANGKKVKTDCSVNYLAQDGKTYCFSNEQAKFEFIGDAAGNAAKAAATAKK